MMLLLIVAGALAGALLLRRRRSRLLDTRAGLVVERPTFTVTPPVRSLVTREEYRW